MKKCTVLFFLFVSVFNLLPIQSKLLDNLDLTDEQTQKINVLMTENELKMEELLIELQIKQYELKKLLLNDAVNKNTLKDALNSIAVIEVEIRFLKYTQELDILKILSNDQKKKYKIAKLNKERSGSEQ